MNPLWLPRPCVQKYLSKYSGIFLTRLALESSGEGSRRFVVIVSIAFPGVGGEEFHELLVMGNYLL